MYVVSFPFLPLLQLLLPSANQYPPIATNEFGYSYRGTQQKNNSVWEREHEEPR